MNEQQNEKNNLSIPAAIVLAGLLVALGIFMSGRSSNPNTPAANNSQAQSLSVSIKPVSASEHILGDPNAPITIVEFSDTECPYCKVFQTTMETIMTTYGKNGTVAWVYRDFPLDIHPLSEKESEALECATELGGNTAFWKYESEIYATTTSNNTLDPAKLPIIAKDAGVNVAAFNTCLASGKYAATVQAGITEAESAGAQGTPFSIMVLKTPLSPATENTINAYIANNGLAQNVMISSDNKAVVLNGALPIQIVTYLIDAVVK